MSELPWENKKVSDAMSSAGKEAKLSDTSEGEPVKKSIPDILANAFSDMPMEEVKIEIPEFDAEKSTPVQNTGFSFPFADLPDLSSLGAQGEDESKNKNADSPAAQPLLPSLPPFMSAPEKPVFSEGLAPDSESKPLFEPEGALPGTAVKDPFKEQASKKRSPPPLFEPAFLSEQSGGKPVSGNMPPLSSLSLPEFPEPAGIGEESSASMPQDIASEEQSVSPEAPVNPFAGGPVPVSANPLAGSSESVSVNPFAGGSGPVSANPFAVGSEPVSANPFAGSSGPVSANPFAGSSKPVSANPFAVGSESASFNPFQATPASGSVNPFSDSGEATDKLSAGSGVSGKKIGFNSQGLKKNIGNISVIAKDLFKNLTKGKSLLERVEDMRAGSEAEVTEVSGLIDADASPSDSETSEPDMAIENLFMQVESSNAEVSSANPFEAESGPVLTDNIRKITPVEKPATKSPDTDVFEDSDFPAQDMMFPEDDGNEPSFVHIAGLQEEDAAGTDRDDSDIKVFNIINTDNIAAADHRHDDENISLTDRKSTISAEKSLLSFRSEDSDSLSEMSEDRLNTLEKDLLDFGSNLSGIDLQFNFLQEKVAGFSDRISGLDEAFASFVKSSEKNLSSRGSNVSEMEAKIVSVQGKIGEFESSLSGLQNDNAGMRSDLLRIEENITELVESYSALLVQLHESMKENESNFSRMDAISVKLDEIGIKVSSVEKAQEGAKATSTEFSRSVSSMLDNIGRNSAEFTQFKELSEQKNTALLEKIESMTEYVEKELQKIGARSYKGFGQNVHLSSIVKNSSNMKLCMEWLEFLMELVGRNNLPDILSYYEELGWISEKVRMELLHYAEGIDFYMEKPDWKLTPDDHVKSIWFIESLAGMKVDKNRLSVIERDIEKVRKGSEIYGI